MTYGENRLVRENHLAHVGIDPVLTEPLCEGGWGGGLQEVWYVRGWYVKRWCVRGGCERWYVRGGMKRWYEAVACTSWYIRGGGKTG